MITYRTKYASQLCTDDGPLAIYIYCSKRAGEDASATNYKAIVPTLDAGIPTANFRPVAAREESFAVSREFQSWRETPLSCLCVCADESNA